MNLTINNILIQTSCLPSEHLKQRAGIQAREEEEGDPRAFQFLLHHMKSFVINKSVVYALYMAVCASKHTHTHTSRDPLKHSHICQQGYYYCEFIASGHLIVPFDHHLLLRRDNRNRASLLSTWPNWYQTLNKMDFSLGGTVSQPAKSDQNNWPAPFALKKRRMCKYWKKPGMT